MCHHGSPLSPRGVQRVAAYRVKAQVCTQERCVSFRWINPSDMKIRINPPDSFIALDIFNEQTDLEGPFLPTPLSGRRPPAGQAFHGSDPEPHVIEQADPDHVDLPSGGSHDAGMVSKLTRLPTA